MAHDPVTEPHRLSATDMARAIAAGDLTSAKIALSCLERITARNDDVRAWAHLDPDRAIASVASLPTGPLNGIPVGVKDIIDTADMPTEFGSKIYTGNRPDADARSIASVRALGGLVMGKTVTTEFAWRRANETRNPHNPVHTPGGSSSGSAAAVADFQVPLAIGTQTAGSVIRPAAYCGIVGFKPSYRRYPTGGVKSLSPSLDTVGIFARSVTDIAFFDGALTGTNHDLRGAAPRLALFVPFRDQLKDAGAKALEDTAHQLSATGVGIREISDLPGFAATADAHGIIMAGEIGRTLHYELVNFPHLLNDYYRENITLGATIPDTEINAALSLVAESRRQAATVFKDVDLILSPPAPGPAPAGLENTGDPMFNKVWTALHWPTITLPVNKDGRLPVGIQLVAASGEESRLLAGAAWVEAALQKS